MKTPGFNPDQHEVTVFGENKVSLTTLFLEKIDRVAQDNHLNDSALARYNNNYSNQPVLVRDYDVHKDKPEMVYTVYRKGKDPDPSLYAVLTSKHHLVQLRKKLPVTISLEDTAFDHLPLRVNEELLVVTGKEADSCSVREEIYRLAEIQGQAELKGPPAHLTLQ